MKTFIYGSYLYEYELIRQERKTLSLTVKPNLQIILKSPHYASEERIEAFLKRKWLWLEKQLRLFIHYQRKLYTKEYVSGESFLYLGKQYKLVIKRANKEKVLLLKRELLLYTVNKVSNTACNERILTNWYRRNTTYVLKKRYEKITKDFAYPQTPELIIYTMKKRWGSYLSKEKIYLNPKLIHTATDCIDYVITHELCHMKHKGHNLRFYQLLEDKFPKWEKVKDKLEMYNI